MNKLPETFGVGIQLWLDPVFFFFARLTPVLSSRFVLSRFYWSHFLAAWINAFNIRGWRRTPWRLWSTAMSRNSPHTGHKITSLLVLNYLTELALNLKRTFWPKSSPFEIQTNIWWYLSLKRTSEATSKSSDGSKSSFTPYKFQSIMSKLQHWAVLLVVLWTALVN